MSTIRDLESVLNSRLERLQHAKLAADQGCLKFRIRQERFEVYEEQATLLCKKLIEIVKKQLEERRGLYAVEQRTFDDFPSTGDGLTMYEAHRELQNYIVELIKRYRADLKLLTGTRDEEDAEEFIRDFYGKEPNGYLVSDQQIFPLSWPENQALFAKSDIVNHQIGTSDHNRVGFG